MSWVPLATVFLVITLVTAERWWPLKHGRVLDGEGREDVFWWGTNELLARLGTSALALFLGAGLARLLGGPLVDLGSWPPAARFTVLFFGYDLMCYASHRSLHEVPFLWRFHQLHHTSERLNALSAFRYHWAELMYQELLGKMLFALVGAPMAEQAVASFLVTVACCCQHVNLRWSGPAFLRAALVTPRNHRWHHSLQPLGRKGQNYGLFLTLWDRVLGTHLVPDHEPQALGLRGRLPSTLLGRLAYPFTPPRGR